MDLQNNTATKVAALDERGVTLERDGKPTKFIPWGEDAEARAAAAKAQTTANTAKTAAQAADGKATAAQKAADDAATEAATAQETAEDAQNAADAAQTAADAADGKATAAQTAAQAADSKATAAQTAADAANTKADAAAQTADKCVKKELTGSDRMQPAGRALQHQDGNMWMIGESSSGTPLLNFSVGEPAETIAQIFTRTSSTLDAARIRLDRVQRTTSESGTVKNRMTERIGIEIPGSGSGSVPSHQGRFEVDGTQLTPQFVYSVWTIDMDFNTTFFLGVYKGKLSNQDYYLLGANAFKRTTGTMDGEGTMLAMRILS